VPSQDTGTDTDTDDWYCLPLNWMLKSLETSTARPVVLCGLSHAAMGTRLPAHIS
jgi:hypothetical protein